MAKRALAVFTITAFIFSPGILWAEGAAEIGRLSYIEGRADRAPKDTLDYTPLVKDTPVSAGDVVRTKAYSRAEISFKDGSVMRLGENSQVRIEDFALNPDGTRQNALFFLDRGTLRAIVEKSRDGQANWHMKSPNAEGAVKGSDIAVSYLKSATGILSMDGEFIARNPNFPDKEISVKKGTTAVIPHDAPPAQPRNYLEIEKQRIEKETSASAQALAHASEGGMSRAIASQLSGDVRVKSHGAQNWHRAALNEALGEGDEIETGADGTLTFVLDSGRDVTLKPGTQIKITKFVFDPKTNTREEYLEAQRGEIRVRLEKLKGLNSKFEVKTPTAVAAVRGTIKYLFITPTGTRAYFQDGKGFISCSNGSKGDVGNGQNAACDESGNFTGVIQTTDEELERLRQGWGDNVFGYSSPGGGDFQPGTGDTGGNNPPNPGDGGPFVFDQIPTNVPPGESSGSSPIQLAIWNAEDSDDEGDGGDEGDSLYAMQYGESGGYLDWAGEETGIVSGVPPWGSTQSFGVVGSFFDIYGGERNLIVNSPLFSRSETTVIGEEGEETIVTDANSDGSALFGYATGTWLADFSIDGYAAALYRDPAGNLGLLSGDFSGAHGLELFLISGSWTADPISMNPGIDSENFQDFIHNGSLYGSVAGDFDGAGSIWGQSQWANTYFLHDPDTSLGEPFGIFDIKFGSNNVYYFANEGSEGPTNFNFAYGGQGNFGNSNDDGYFLLHADGEWENGALVGDLSGPALTYTHLVELEGRLFGLFETDEDGYGIWTGSAVGTYRSQELAFNGNWGGGRSSLYYNSDGYPNWSGEDQGLIGATQSPWPTQSSEAEDTTFLAMGTYYNYYSDDLIWNTPFVSHNYLADNQATNQGNAAFYGFSAGIWKDGTLDGAVAAIYVDPLGGAGVLTSHDVSGNYDPEIEMWQAEGTLHATQLASGVNADPANLSDYIDSGYMDGDVFGTFIPFNDDAYLDGYLAWGSTYFLHDGDYEYAEPWGIFDFKVAGESYLNPAGASDWFAFFSGEADFSYEEGEWLGVARNGTWGGGRLEADFFGIYYTEEYRMGLLLGDLFGIHETFDENHTWIATSVGYYEPFDFYGYASGGDLIEDGNFFVFEDYEDEWESFEQFGSIEAVFGGVGDLFSGSPVPTYLIGSYYAGEEYDGVPNKPWLWAVEMQGGNPDGYESSNPFAFFGFAGGGWDDEVTGNARLLYIRSTENSGTDQGDDPYVTGILKGRLAGRYLEDYGGGNGYYEEVGAFYLEGLFQQDGLEYLTEIAPDELFGSLEELEIYGGGQGTFEEGGQIWVEAIEGSLLAIDGQDWGVWGATVGGYYEYGEGAENGVFRTTFAGELVEYFDDEGEDTVALFLGIANGEFGPMSEDTDFGGNVTAGVNGVWFSEAGDGFLNAGRITGDVDGNYNPEGTFHTLVVGVWESVTVLDAQAVGFDIAELSNFADNAQAVTELHNSISNIQGGFNGGSILGTMDASFFAAEAISNGIWTAFFNGTFSGLPAGDNPAWSAAVSGDVTATLQGLQWADGQWLANVVNGAAPDGVTFSGQAGGTYNLADAASGTFEGVGAGTWQAPSAD